MKINVENPELKGIQLESQRGHWVAEPLGEVRLLPRTRFAAGTTIGQWEVDLQTGIAKSQTSN